MSGFEALDSLDRELVDVAGRAADDAAAVHRDRSPDGRAWSEKGRADFVTDVDLEAQTVILDALAEAFPDHAVVAEEEPGSDGGEREPGDPGGRRESGGGTPATSSDRSDPPVRWIVDPLDGTTNWLHGYPEYAVSIAAEDAGGLRAAVVLNSATGERFEAVRGGGALRDGRPIRVSGVDQLEMALVGTGFPFKKPEYMDEYVRVFRRLLFRTSGVRRGGSAALDLCDLACGRLDAFWEHWLMPWDVAAGALILKEAGGHLETFPLPDAGASSPADTDPSAGTDAASSTRADAGPSPPDAAGGSSDAPPTFATRRGRAYLGSNAALLETFRDAVLGAGVPA